MDLFLYFFKAYPRRTIVVFITVTIASIITAATLLVLPALLFTLLGRDTTKTQFINDAFTQLGIQPNTENLITFFFIGIILQNLLLAAANIYAGFTKAKVIKDLRIKLLNTMSKTEWAFFTKQSSGNFTASLVNEIDSAGDGYETMVLILSNVVQMIAYLSVAFFISWPVALIAIVSSLILTLLFGKLIKISRQLGAEDAQLTRLITSQVTDSYRSIKSLKAMSRESYSHALLNSYTKKIKAVAKKGTITTQVLDALQEIILMSTVIFTIYFAFQHLNIPLEFSIILVILYLRSMKLFGKSQKQYQAFVGNISGYNMVMKSMTNALNNLEHRTGTKKHFLKGNINFKNIYFQYGDKKILDDASATFYHHKLNSIIGLSGEGKTTAADLICGLFQPTSGDILIDDVPLSEIDITHWRKQIGYVTQETNLLNTSIKENVTLGDPNFTDRDVENALKKAHALDFIRELPSGTSTIVGENGSNLSGGQRQRILIARALVHSPQLLILDEATSALDLTTEKLLSNVFKELSKELTIISISHRPAIKERSDYILSLQNKKLIKVSNN